VHFSTSPRGPKAVLVNTFRANGLQISTWPCQRLPWLRAGSRMIVAIEDEFEYPRRPSNDIARPQRVRVNVEHKRVSLVDHDPNVGWPSPYCEHDTRRRTCSVLVGAVKSRHASRWRLHPDRRRRLDQARPASWSAERLSSEARPRQRRTGESVAGRGRSRPLLRRLRGVAPVRKPQGVRRIQAHHR
jgi:hypothetical protein